MLKFLSTGAEEAGIRSVYLGSSKRAGNLIRASAKGGPGSPVDMLAPPPPINKLPLLKTAAFVLNFKLFPPKSTALPPALNSPLFCFQNSKTFESTVIVATSFKHFMSCAFRAGCL